MLHCMLVEMQKTKKTRRCVPICGTHRPLSNGWSGRQALLWQTCGMAGGCGVPVQGHCQLSAFPCCLLMASYNSWEVAMWRPMFDKFAFKILQSFLMTSMSMPLGSQSGELVRLLVRLLRWAVTVCAVWIGERSWISRKCPSLQGVHPARDEGADDHWLICSLRSTADHQCGGVARGHLSLQPPHTFTGNGDYD